MLTVKQIQRSQCSDVMYFSLTIRFEATEAKTNKAEFHSVNSVRPGNTSKSARDIYGTSVWKV